MVLESVTVTVLQYVNYGITILGLVGVYEAFRLLAGPKKTDEVTSADWKNNPALKGVNNLYRRWYTKNLNEYANEDKEYNYLSDIEKSRELALELVYRAISTNKLTDGSEKAEMIRAIMAVRGNIKIAVDFFRKVNKTTWRQERGMKKLMKKLEDKEKPDSVNKVKALENSILEKHKHLKGYLDNLLKVFDESEGNLDIINKWAPTYPININVSPNVGGIAVSIRNTFIKLQKMLTNLENGIKQCIDTEADVKTDVTGIMLEVKRNW